MPSHPLPHLPPSPPPAFPFFPSSSGEADDGRFQKFILSGLASADSRTARSSKGQIWVANRMSGLAGLEFLVAGGEISHRCGCRRTNWRETGGWNGELETTRELNLEFVYRVLGPTSF
ncbi:hypothetical protein EJB05_21779, partial [Eragrostis curvula]